MVDSPNRSRIISRLVRDNSRFSNDKGKRRPIVAAEVNATTTASTGAGIMVDLQQEWSTTEILATEPQQEYTPQQAWSSTEIQGREEEWNGGLDWSAEGQVQGETVEEIQNAIGVRELGDEEIGGGMFEDEEIGSGGGMIGSDL
jgi:hypothetical protein